MTLAEVSLKLYAPGSELLIFWMVIPPLVGDPYNGYINPYYWLDDHPPSYGNHGSLDPGTYEKMEYFIGLGWRETDKLRETTLVYI